MVHPGVVGVARVPVSGVGQAVLQGWRPKDEVDAEAAAAESKTKRKTTEES